MIADNQPRMFTVGSKDRPLLVVIQNMGGVGTPNLRVGRHPYEMLKGQDGILVGPGNASPQLTVTEPYYIMSDTVGTNQTYQYTQDNLGGVS